MWHGILTEVYYPTVDRPQLRDLQYLITDGEHFLHQEKHDLATTTERLAPEALGYRVTNADPDGRYRIVKEVIADPLLPCVLQHTQVQGDPALLSRLRLYVLCNPHLGGGGWGNNGALVEVAGRTILTAEKEGLWLALAATLPFARLSCGYVGRSDGWTDLADNFEMDWAFDEARDGNVALTGKVPLDGREVFTLGLAFGASLHNATTTLLQALGLPFEEQRKRFVEQWSTQAGRAAHFEQAAGDGGRCYHASVSVILAHEDKTYPGALIASPSIPWGEAHGDQDRGGYHLVWTRDMVQSTTALLAAGNTELPLRALIYLAISQQPDGGFPQNFWIDGTPQWTGIQLDEVAAPILLAWRLREENALRDFDPYPLVSRAARYLIEHGPATQQERWEEAGGYAPSTLAATIAALVCAAAFARERKDTATAQFLEEYADFLEGHVEDWTMTTDGTLVPAITRHYIRINPVDVHAPQRNEDPNQGALDIANQPPGARRTFPAKEIVDAGFLQLVRFGIRAPDDPVIVDSLRVVDVVLKVDTPFGPSWHRYNHDGYGQRPDGGPFEGWGKGRAWPLLTGERGHYELAAGGDPGPFIRAMEGFASPTGLLPEQVWDEPDRPEVGMSLGRPTGAAMPLLWAHAEYVKLLRSAADGQVFDRIPAVAERYGRPRRTGRVLEVWSFNRQPSRVAKGATLRVQAAAPFRLHWTGDEWQTVHDTSSSPTALGIEFVDLPVPDTQQAPIRFTFFWIAANRWEGRDYVVAV
jgi:glucoamylase